MDNLTSLTPAHLLMGYRLDSFPDVSHVEELMESGYNEKPILDELSKNMVVRLEHFWKKWRAEYLLALRERKNSLHGESCTVKIGQVVLIHEDLVPRAKWKLGLITELYKSNDGKIRSVKLKTAKGETNRPISKLYPLEVESDVSFLSTENDSANERPRRLAAIRALDLMKSC